MGAAVTKPGDAELGDGHGQVRILRVPQSVVSTARTASTTRRRWVAVRGCTSGSDSGTVVVAPGTVPSAIGGSASDAMRWPSASSATRVGTEWRPSATTTRSNRLTGCGAASDQSSHWPTWSP